MKSVVGFVAIFGLVAATLVYDSVAASEKTTFTVVKNDATLFCERNYIKVSKFGWRVRGFDTEEGPSRFDCGHIETDIGTFILPVSGNPWHWADSPRTEIHAELRKGCRVEVTVVGKGDPNGDSRSERKSWMKRVAHVHANLGCDFAEN